MAEVANIARLGLRGVKFHPSLQAFDPADPQFWPVFAACAEHGLLALFHTGTSGIGARQPGGQGIRIDYAHPLRLDPVAAAHPGLTVVAAHFGCPWQMDLIAVALHKTNVYIDISGWSPRRVPAEVTGEPEANSGVCGEPATAAAPWGRSLSRNAPPATCSGRLDAGVERTAVWKPAWLRLRRPAGRPAPARNQAGLCAFLLSFFITQRDADRQLGAA